MGYLKPSLHAAKRSFLMKRNKILVIGRHNANKLDIIKRNRY